MRAMLQKSLSALLVLLLCIMTGWHGGSAVASQDSSSSVSVCKCCDSHRGNCPTPACCARPGDNRTPAAPAAPRSASTHQWHALPPAPATLLTLLRSTLDALMTVPPPSHSGAVSIFQRDCSYLI